MGYYQNKHANWLDYAEREGIERTCDHCGKTFTPTSPNQKRHSYEQDSPCWYGHWTASLSRDAWIRNVTGYTVKEFIEIYGMDTYRAL